MILKHKSTRITDSQFSKRRPVFGIPVLVNPPFESDGVVKDNFTIRIKYPFGVSDIVAETNYYWQAFNDARDYIQLTWIQTAHQQ